MFELPHHFPGDGYEHRDDRDCPCQPRIEPHGGLGLTVVHQPHAAWACPDTFPAGWLDPESAPQP